MICGYTAATIARLAGVHPKVLSERHGHAFTQITWFATRHGLESMQEARRTPPGDSCNLIGPILVQATVSKLLPGRRYPSLSVSAARRPYRWSIRRHHHGREGPRGR
jgi:hypothetical protein